jgi:ion channel-forming bestrophin family protein
MVSYDPKQWFKLIFQFHKTDTFRILLPNMVVLSLFTAGLVYLETDYYHLNFKATTVFHQILGFVLSMLLVFRINTAYDRWWEGRKLWGSLVNNTRSMAIKLNALLDENQKEARLKFVQLIQTYPYALKNQLRGRQLSEKFIFYKQPEFVEGLKNCPHAPNYVAAKVTSELVLLSQQGLIETRHLPFLNEELRTLTEVSGACERIKNTPIPYSYSLFLKKIIFIYVITMPFPFSIDFKYWAIPIVIFIFYAFASLELISEEIEDPFGEDSNDLPLDDMAKRIGQTVEELLLGKH